MCGITGFLSFNSNRDENRGVLTQHVARMAAVMAPRGPDDQDTWVDPATGVGFGFRRLAIVDLAPTGKQPMISRSGRFVMVFNGEIYNHRQLRKCLENQFSTTDGYVPLSDQPAKSESDRIFRGHSDTEVLLAGIETWGFEETLRKSVGMFAIALWDRRDKVLYLARDRMGEKPLYYGLAKNTLLFGSELKALQAHPDFEPNINRNVLQLYMRHACVPAPHSIFEGTFKLPPGCTLTLTASRKKPEYLPVPKPYWSAHHAAIEGQANPLHVSDAEATTQLERLLAESISGQMMADVPVGAFLSGGIDSSTVVAVMQSLSSQPVKTFSIGFDDSRFNEANHAKLVAQHLGTDHHELYVTGRQARDVIPKLPEIYDEPFSDSSQIPTYLVSALAKQHVTVSLSGDGGDELFGGYSRYYISERLWRYASFVPSFLRKGISQRLENTSALELDRKFRFLEPWLQKYGAPTRISNKLNRVNGILKCKNFQQFYRSVMSAWKSPEDILLDSSDNHSVFNDPDACQGLQRFQDQMRYLDQMHYLPDDILVKVDRAAMAVSLETRIPLLDHRIVEFCWRLPNRFLRRRGTTKWLLRQVLQKHVPKKLVDRPKMGFGVPLTDWLRGPLRDWAENLFDEAKLREDGFFNVPLVRNRWQEHLQGTADWQNQLWVILMFQAWHQHSLNDSLAVQTAA